ncbi:MAG: response regulator [Candidatus Omnitrophica bacterium]|nr:response regulator [Candidatus Omnitrophota bacterium]
MDKKRILIVDDEDDLRKMLKLRLQALDYDILEASDGKEGLDKARSEKPDLMILDLMLPKMDGYKVCRMLKFDEKFKHIPIIMFTSRGEDEYRATGKEVGADAYVQKPFETDALVGKIRELLK